MLVIGLTGGIGSGKSTVAELFQLKGVPIIDADLIAREVVEPGQPALQEIAEHFGTDILDEHGALRRKALRELVFSSPAERSWLEQLLHPLIHTVIQQRITSCEKPYCILMSPLLLETTQRQLTDRILIVDVDRATQLQRTMQRDASPRETIEAIIDAQISRAQRRAAADDVIVNDGDVSELALQVDRLHANYLNLASTFKIS
ncbi:MAG: dephospho-CoA kinase [Gammaproteobacteria bacterium]|nr:dephospho-CoA kinase [Gammaproteobacteria bacterium]